MGWSGRRNSGHHTAEIEAAEREIDAIVYKLFDLSSDEIKLLEASLEGSIDGA